MEKPKPQNYQIYQLYELVDYMSEKFGEETGKAIEEEIRQCFNFGNDRIIWYHFPDDDKNIDCMQKLKEEFGFKPGEEIYFHICW